MVVYGASEMADTGGAGFVSSNAAGGNEVFRHPNRNVGNLRRTDRSGSHCWRSRCAFRTLALGCISAEGDRRVKEGKTVLEEAA